MSVAFNAGMLAALVASGLFLSWVVTDCQGKSPAHQCTVSYAPDWSGVLHFKPVPEGGGRDT
jgi:hypothetical protein